MLIAILVMITCNMQIIPSQLTDKPCDVSASVCGVVIANIKVMCDLLNGVIGNEFE